MPVWWGEGLLQAWRVWPTQPRMVWSVGTRVTASGGGGDGHSCGGGDVRSCGGGSCGGTDPPSRAVVIFATAVGRAAAVCGAAPVVLAAAVVTPTAPALATCAPPPVAGGSTVVPSPLSFLLAKREPGNQSHSERSTLTTNHHRGCPLLPLGAAVG